MFVAAQIYYLYASFVCMQASKKYLTVARSMKSYEDELYQGWLETVESTLPELLKRTVLCKPPPPLPRPGTQTPGSGYTSRPVSRIEQLQPGIYSVVTEGVHKMNIDSKSVSSSVLHVQACIMSLLL